MRTVVIKENEAGQRMDKFLAKYLCLAPKSFLYKMMRKKNITLNGKRCEGAQKLVVGDVVQLFLAEETIEKFSRLAGETAGGFSCLAGETAGEFSRLAEGTEGGGKVNSRTAGGHGQRKRGRLDIVYEDEHILLVNKPSGLLSQKAKPGDVSLVEEILAYLLETGQVTEETLRTFRPSVCNRLDRNTSGLVIAGKSLAGLQRMAEGLKDRSIHKSYQCIVRGRVEERQRISGFLKKDERTNQVVVYGSRQEGSVPIVTEYIPQMGNERYTLLEVKLITGRTHQIRAHLASIGHPIAGDYKYGDRAVNQEMKEKYRVQSQLLHAWKLEFPELGAPLEKVSKRVFTAPLPPEFLRVEKGESFA